jgi:hypothetical protein
LGALTVACLAKKFFAIPHLALNTRIIHMRQKKWCKENIDGFIATKLQLTPNETEELGAIEGIVMFNP